MIYISDRGLKFEVSVMETSHLINAITHHAAQRKTLLLFTQYPAIQQRYDTLGEVINVLADELAQRDVEPDEYLIPYEEAGPDHGDI